MLLSSLDSHKCRQHTLTIQAEHVAVMLKELMKSLKPWQHLENQLWYEYAALQCKSQTGQLREDRG